MRSFYSLAIVPAVLTSAAVAQTSSSASPVPIPSYTGCPPDGPLLPRPTGLSESKHIRSAVDNLTSQLNSAVDGTIKPGWPVENVSFSVALVSPNTGTEDPKPNKPLWEYHHRAKLNAEGAKELTGDTQYLIGSISKVFSDLLLLQSSVNLQDPVTKFFPELVSDTSPIRWEGITLEALAGHLAGISPNYVYEFYALQPLYEELGLPHLEKSDYPECSVTGLNSACTKQQILQGLRSKLPVAPVNSRPVYSQLSFLLFSLALETATGKNYSQLLDEFIIQPLNLTNTGVSPGDTQRAIIPPGMSLWGSDYGLNTPGGGLYSSLNDLTRLVNAILDKSVLSTAAEVHHWLKPSSMTGSPSTLVGGPWEILRTSDLVPAHPHNVDIYGKSGGAMNYVSQISVIDQYGVGVVVLTAGSPAAMNVLNRALIGSLIPAVEEEARDQARRYVGNWTTAHSARNSSASIEMRVSMDGGQGLKLDSLTRDGHSMIDAIKTIWEYQYAANGFGILDPDLRIYPAEIEIPVPPSEAKVLLASSRLDLDIHKVDLVRQDWRINFDVIPSDGTATSDLPGQDTLSTYCTSWQTVDWMYYGNQSLDRIVFVVDKNSGKIVGAEVPVTRGGLLT